MGFKQAQDERNRSKKLKRIKIDLTLILKSVRPELVEGYELI